MATAEGLEHLSAEIFGTGDRTAGGCFVTGGFHRTVGLGAGDRLTGEGFADAHLPGGIGGGGLLGAVAVGAAGAGAAVAGTTGSTGLALQFTDFLGQLTGTQIRVDLAGDSRGTGLGGVAGGLTALAQGLTASQHQGAAGVVLGGSLTGSGATLTAGTAGARGSPLAGERQGCRTGLGGIAGLLLALALVFSSGRRGCLRSLLRDVGASAIFRCIRALTAAGHGFAAGEHQVAAGVRNTLAGVRPMGAAGGG